MNTGQKITIGFLAVVAIFTIFGYSIYLNEKSIESTTSRFTGETIIELNTLQELKSSTLRVLSSTMEIILIMDEGVHFEQQQQQQQQQIENELEIEKKLILEAKTNFENALDILHDLTIGDPFELDNINNIEKEWNVFLSISQELIEAKESGISGIELLELKEELEETETNLLKSIDIFIEHEFDEVIEQGTIIESSFSTNFQIILWGIVTVIIASVIIATITSSKIGKDQKIITEQIRKLKEADKLKDEFASMITHELKTPLSPIMMYCELLKEKSQGELNADQLESVKEIYINTLRLERLIGDILDAQKLAMNTMTFDKQKIDPAKLLDKVMKDVSVIRGEKQIEFVNSNSSNSTILADEGRMIQTMENLVRNSVDFVPDKHGRIEVGARDEDSKVIFYVKDNGIGIPKDKQVNLFKKFYQVDTSHTRKHAGTGLGLVICKGIVEGSGGRIWLESEKGKGANFYFSIPKEPKKS